MSEAIRFGTSGWRGVLTDEVTWPRARALVAGVGRWLREPGPHGGRPARGGPARVLVAHDTRFLGAELASLACDGLAATGQVPLRAVSPVPTPVVAAAVRHGVADAAIVFTASHNPPEYQGAKVIGSWGGGVSDEQARRIEAHARRACVATRSPARARRGDPARLDLVPAYLHRLGAWIGPKAGRRTGSTIVYDGLQGTGVGVCDRALERLGHRVESLSGEASPRFGGGAPDPTPDRLAGLVDRVRARRGRAIGLATDGDADRYAVVDRDGSLLTETEALALLVDWLARTGRVRRGLAISIATGTLVEQVASEHGLSVVRHPIGFKHLAEALASGAADVAGEESGGFAAGALARDKDGILACALFAEMTARERAPLRTQLLALARRHGPSACGRTALPADDRVRARLARLIAAPPEHVAGVAVREVETRDGLRLALADGFLMLRASGTEPVLRLYAEAPSPRALARRLAEGRALLLRVDGSADAN